MKDYSLKINGQNYNVQIDEVNETSTVAHVTVNGTPYEVEIAGASAAAPSRPQVAPAPREANSGMITPSTAAPSPRIAPAASAGGSVVKCPLPGTVLAIKVAVGDTVAAGQTLVVLEAMKMENSITTDYAGKVTRILVEPGQTVPTDAVLVEIE